MRRSKKELKALESAYEIALLVKCNSANVIAYSSENDNIESDTEWLEYADTYILWYENNLKT